MITYLLTARLLELYISIYGDVIICHFCQSIYCSPFNIILLHFCWWTCPLWGSLIVAVPHHCSSFCQVFNIHQKCSASAVHFDAYASEILRAYSLQGAWPFPTSGMLSASSPSYLHEHMLCGLCSHLYRRGCGCPSGRSNDQSVWYQPCTITIVCALPPWSLSSTRSGASFDFDTNRAGRGASGPPRDSLVSLRR